MTKPLKHIKNVRIVAAQQLWPHREELAGKFVATCEVHGTDEDRGITDGHPIRTSLLVKIDIENGIIETLNTMYQIHSGL